MGFGPWVNLLDGLRVGVGGILLVLLAHFWR